ncbi:pyrroline-5-carboxylate reductase [Anatilimnocola floriformis]|uniref:pyrroline-5-carboxylate reductase n=1 Tax=Anatilimnocola floriformis TaxID=2948575 RepID=UPI0020C30C60|nr:pyrroline-5-carboxylate reductase [Anatilimnocola floriformis]
MSDLKIGFIGAGQMATALAQGFVRANILPAAKISASDAYPAATDKLAKDLPGLKVASNAEVAAASDVVILAVKPQVMPAVYKDLAGKLANKLVISIAAGISLEKLCAGLKTERVVRVMPNTPCLVGQGASAFALASGATAADGELVKKLLSAVGIAHLVDEKLLDAVTGLSGSGPAYVYLIIEALSDGGVKAGLPRALATSLAAQTVLGAAQMVLTRGEHPGVLKDAVASPGGTTIAGLATLEDRGLRGALIAAVDSATKRSQELGK